MRLIGLVLGALLALPLAQASAAGGERPPNIVLVLTDDQAFESLDQMPYVSAREDWIRFTNAYLNTPICCPARATILNGRYSHHNKVETNFDGRNFKAGSSIATWLRRSGYRTAFFGKYLNGYPWGRREGRYVPPGWDRWVAFKGASRYYDYTLNQRGGPRGLAQARHKGSEPADYSTDLLAAKAVDFIGKAGRRRQPFFTFLSLYGPHGPTDPAPRHALTFQGTAVTQPRNFNEADVSDKPAWVQAKPLRDPAEMAEKRRRQYRALLSVDDAVRNIFGKLRERNELKRTVVIFLSDNGLNFGEHRLTGKSCAYEECIHTPLLIRAPGIEGRRERALVSSVDLAPTIAELAGVSPKGNVDGEALGELLRGERDHVRRAMLLRGKRSPPPNGENQPLTFWGVRTQRFKYIETVQTGERELYDLKNDPFELSNVVGAPGYAKALAALDRRLDELRSNEDGDSGGA